ncbi:MAG: hypothetical protein ACREDZ_14905 [Kiloniellales bacterium]
MPMRFRDFPAAGLAIAGLVLLAGCSFTGPTAPAETPAAVGTAPPPPAEVSPQDQAPSANAAPATPAAPRGAGSETSVVTQGPGGEVITTHKVDEAQYRADADSCRTYADAQVGHDMRIEDDRSGAFFDSGWNRDAGRLTRSMQSFEQENRRAALFEECLAGLGYVQR